MKILKELKKKKKAVNRNSDYYKKELENMRRNQEKLEHSFAEMKAELKEKNSRMNNAEEGISDLKDRVIEITQFERQMKNDENNIKRLGV